MDQAAIPSPTIDDRSIWDIWLSIHHFPAMATADEVGLFKALCTNAATADELATRLDIDARATGVLLGLLAGLGLVERREGLWQATVVTRTYLDPGSPFYWGTMLSAFKERNPLCERVAATLKKGGSTGQPRPSDAWERGQLEPEVARHIAGYMHAHSLAASVGAARGGDFHGVRTLLDVGGGSGVFCIEIARHWPDLKATVMDLEPMCQAAQTYIDAAGCSGRVDTRAVDMFREPWPTGYDALFFSNIYHDWDDLQCRDLSAKAFDVLPSGGRIYLHEALMNDNGDGPTTTASFSVLMLLGTRGRQYTLAELRGFLEGAGFQDVRSTPTCSYYSLVSARRP